MKRSYDRNRLENLALYIASRSTNDPKFGKTKLAKILFYSDFTAYTDLGESITGAVYSKFPNGPFPRALGSALERIAKSGRGRIAVADYFGNDQERLVCLEAVQISDFTPEEISLVDQVIELFRDGDAAKLSAFSHREPGWLYVDDMAEIPYELAWVASGDPPEDVITAGQEVAKRLGLLCA